MVNAHEYNRIEKRMKRKEETSQKKNKFIF